MEWISENYKMIITENAQTAHPIRYNAYLSQYGYNVRRANFKKMVIIYTINQNTIYIHRIMPASLIS